MKIVSISMDYLPYYKKELGKSWLVDVILLGEDGEKWRTHKTYPNRKLAKVAYTALINLKEIFDEHGLSE